MASEGETVNQDSVRLTMDDLAKELEEALAKAEAEANAKGKKGKKRKSKKKKGPKITPLDRKQCVSQITELARKLAPLRKQLVDIEKSHEALATKLQILHDDREDVASFLQRRIEEKTLVAEELEERFVQISTDHAQEQAEALEYIKESERKYKVEIEQLNSEISLLGGKLRTLEEFRKLREEMLIKYDEIEERRIKTAAEHKEQLFHVQQQAIVKRNKLRQEIEKRLEQLEQDMVHSCDVRSAAYTRDLIRDNCTMQKQLDRLVRSRMRTHKTYERVHERLQHMCLRHKAERQLKEHLRESVARKEKVIQQLTVAYDRIQESYVEVVRMHAQYERNKEKQKLRRLQKEELDSQLKRMQASLQELLDIKTQLEKNDQIYDEKIRSRRAEVKAVEEAILSTLSLVEEGRKQKEQEQPVYDTEQQRLAAEAAAKRDLRRHNLLTELLQLVGSHSNKMPLTPPMSRTLISDSKLYVPGLLGFKQKEDNIGECQSKE